MPILQEELLEPVARYLRFRKIIQNIDKSNKFDIVDVGAGPNTPLITFLKKEGCLVSSYTAIDPLSKVTDKNIKYVSRPLIKQIPEKSNSKDYVVAAAFIEHINNPKEILQEMIRIVKPEGKVVITTPTPYSKEILEFLSDKLGFISRREIQEHKNYFDKASLLKLLPKKKKSIKVFHKYFEFGMNNLLVIKK